MPLAYHGMYRTCVCERVYISFFRSKGKRRRALQKNLLSRQESAKVSQGHKTIRGVKLSGSLSRRPRNQARDALTPDMQPPPPPVDLAEGVSSR